MLVRSTHKTYYNCYAHQTVYVYKTGILHVNKDHKMQTLNLQRPHNARTRSATISFKSFAYLKKTQVQKTQPIFSFFFILF
jgi:hypothetical protein